MTAVLTTAKDSFLRFALRLDATLTGLMGLGGLALAPKIAELSGTTTAFEYTVGAAFAVYGVGLYALSRMRDVRTLGIVVAIGNVVFTVAAVGAVLAGIFPLTTVGIVLVLGAGVFTLVMAELQYAGLKRMR